MSFDRLKAVVGPKGFSEDPHTIAPHLEEWRGKYRGTSPLLLQPATTAEVSALLAICHETQTAIVPQGGNTGLVGGQIPFHGEVLLSLSRMNRIRTVDAEGMSLIAEAGTILETIHRAADDVQRLFPLSLASQGSCTIGGNLSTNAGGVDVLRYGPARDLVLGLEVVLADGRVLDLLRTLRKDNTGYDLKQLFIGAEGTLGIITAAALKLFAKPAQRFTAFVAVPSPSAAVSLLARLQEQTGGLVSAFEIMPRIGLDFVLAYIPDTADPLPEPSPWYVLVEATSGANLPLTDVVETALGASSDLVTNAAIAQTEAQAAHLWRLRESMSEAQKP
ncbi:MAG TPA: FAD-binding oxidoreductase, partial [Rhizomicrobium sp.]|nr:FAD-binding oxidoreductase [Rhizomicrobium sp.]